MTVYVLDFDTQVNLTEARAVYEHDTASCTVLHSMPCVATFEAFSSEEVFQVSITHDPTTNEPYIFVQWSSAPGYTRQWRKKLLPTARTNYADGAPFAVAIDTTRSTEPYRRDQ